MITLNNIFQNKDGINFTNNFPQTKEITVKFIEPYSGFTLWSFDMTIESKMSYFCSFPRTAQFLTFCIEDKLSKEIYLYFVDYLHTLTNNLQEIDVYHKLNKFNFKNLKLNETDKPGLILNEIFLLQCYKNSNCDIEPEDLVIDVGGNIGLFSYYAVLKKAKKVYTFEPTKNLYEFIKNNFYDLPIEVFNLAVWSENTHLYLENKEISFLNKTSVQNNEFKNETCSVCVGVNLEEWVNSQKIDIIDYLKLDCEGCEWEFFKTVTVDFLKKIRKIVIEYHENSPQEILEKLNKCGFVTETKHPIIWAWRDEGSDFNKRVKDSQ